MKISFVSWNVHACRGADGVTLQEVLSDEGPAPADQARFLAAETALVPIEGVTLKRESARYGNLLLSALPVLEVARHDISAPGRDPLPLGPVSRLMRGSRLRAPLRRSFPSRWPLLPLDRIGASRELRLESLAVHRTPAARSASDHLPLWARLHLATSIRQPAPGSAGPG